MPRRKNRPNKSGRSLLEMEPAVLPKHMFVDHALAEIQVPQPPTNACRISGCSHAGFAR